MSNLAAPAILLAKIKQEEERRAAEDSLYEFVKQAWHVVEPGVPFIGGWHIRVICEHLEAITNGELRRLLVNIPPRHALRLGTKIPTPGGMVEVENLKVGDRVFGPDGKPVAVTGKSDVFPDRQLYRVWTDDDAFIDVDGEHLWTVRLDRKYKHYNEYTTEQLWHRQNGAFLRKTRGGGTELNFTRVVETPRLPRLPDVAPVQCPDKKLLVDPYVLGIWLGDGTSASSHITMTPEDFACVGAEIERRGYPVRSVSTKYRHLIVKLQTSLRKIGVLNNKHIPEEYFQASETQRRDLLKGLMDTDGYVSKEGQCFFTQSSLPLIQQVLRLIRSLGIKASINESEAKMDGVSFGKAWKITFFANDVFMLPRKESRTKTTFKRYGRYIRIEKLPETGRTQCISVDREDGLFLAGEGYIVTHNSKSTIVSVLWPMWEWIHHPHEKFLCASYSGVLAIRDNLKARRLVQSPWYKERWGHVFSLSGDQNAKQRFENDHTGYRIATSVGGTATGEGGSRLLCLHKDSYIETERGPLKIGELVDRQWAVKVLAYDHDKQVAVLSDILRFEKSEGRRSMKLVTASTEIIATHDHPVFVKGKGYIQLSEVRSGDCLLRCAQAQAPVVEDVVLAVEPVETPDFVYNVAVDEHHNYFANGVLLHNCDDPHSAQEAQSDVVRESALEWFDMVWSTRLNNSKTDAMVVIMQRLHEKDISGHILDDLGGWEHICIPAEFDGVRRKTSLGDYDPRTKKGELICPERMGSKELTELKQLLGEYGTSGQLQQDPAPTGGGILNTKFFKLWPQDNGLPQFEYILQSYDCAFTEKTTGDPTACSVWGVFTYNNARQAMLLDAWDEHLSYPNMRARVVKDWSSEYGGMDDKSAFKKPRRPDRILIEEKASGQSLLQDLRLAKVPAIGYNPGRADKTARAHQAAPILELELLWIPESKTNPGHAVTWAADFLKQLAKFPVAEHDDYVDTFTQAIIYLRNDRWFELPKAKDFDAPLPKKIERVNPYAV